MMDRSTFHPVLIVLALLAGALAIVVGLSGDPQGDIGLFFSTGAEAAPIFLIALLAFLSLDRPRMRPVVAALAVVFVLVLALFSWLFCLTPWMSMIEVEEPPVEMILATLEGMLLCLITVGVCLLGFSRRVRLFLARYIPIDPDNFVHTVALVMITALMIIPPVPLLVIGHPPLVDLMANPEFAIASMTPADAAKSDAYGLFWTIFGSFIAVGLFVKRSLPETLERLGVVMPTLRSVAFALGVGAALVLVFSVVDNAIMAVWEYFGWYVTDADYTEALFASYLTPVAALVAAVVAGVGEEIAIRGVLQPRFGIAISVLVFAALHAYQYAWDGLLSVLLAGLVFAYLRVRTNTTVCAITHATYDFILFSLIILGIG